jgi:hypothetical protein
MDWCYKGDSIALTHFLQVSNLTLFINSKKTHGGGQANIYNEILITATPALLLESAPLPPSSVAAGLRELDSS